MLRSHEIAGLDSVTASDICCGRLKAVLALFFALSRYKQHAKQIKCLGANSGGSGGLCIKADIHHQPQQLANRTLRSSATGGGVNTTAQVAQVVAVSESLTSAADKTSSGQLSSSMSNSSNVLLMNNGASHPAAATTPLQMRGLPANNGDTMLNR